MSYVQIEIGGKKRGWKFNKMAELTFKERIVPGNEMTAVYALVYAGLEANCYVKREEPDFTFETVCDWCDNISSETANAVKAAFEESETYKNGVAYKKELEALQKKRPAKVKPLKK